MKQENKDETRDDARAALEPGVPAEQDARGGAGSSEAETSAPLGSLLGALDLSLAEPRGGALETNANPNANPNPNPFRPSGAAARGGKRRLNLRASAAFGSLAARTPAETADESDESDDELEAALRALPSSAGAGSRDVLRRASTDPETGGNAAETAPPKLDAAESTAAEDSQRFESSPRSSGALSGSSPPRRDVRSTNAGPPPVFSPEDVPPPSEPSADVSRSLQTEPSRVTDRGGEREGTSEIEIRSTNAGPPPVFSPDASATFSESDFDLGSPFPRRARARRAPAGGGPEPPSRDVGVRASGRAPAPAALATPRGVGGRVHRVARARRRLGLVRVGRVAPRRGGRRAGRVLGRAGRVGQLRLLGRTFRTDFSIRTKTTFASNGRTKISSRFRDVVVTARDARRHGARFVFLES